MDQFQGWADVTPSMRSYSISHGLNYGAAESPSFKKWTKIAELDNPSETIQFLEESDQRGHNMGGFIIGSSFKWTDMPASWHSRNRNVGTGRVGTGGEGQSVTMLDGSAEFYYYKDERTKIFATSTHGGSADWLYFWTHLRPEKIERVERGVYW